MDEILHILTDKDSVIEGSKLFSHWVLLIPVCSFAAFLWDGIFIGCTASRQMRNSMFVAVASFFTVYYMLNHFGLSVALWVAFLIYLGMRGVVQTFMFRGILSKMNT